MSLHLPAGFRYAGVPCGIKPSGKPDLMLIVTDQPATAAGVYTQNVVRAASIDWNRTVTPTDQARAVVCNSGNANACTGTKGADDNRAMAAHVAEATGANDNQVCVLSTGVIGHLLPMDCVSAGIADAAEKLTAGEEAFSAASQAILTTDNGPKTVTTTFMIEGQPVTIAGMAKGAGMIGPNMATMLGIITTDASLTPALAQELLTDAADQSFNCISVEGHTSTNDALILLASGASPADLSSESAIESFRAELVKLCIELATKIPADGEGATHLIDIEVTGAADDRDADKIARAIAGSNLVKTAITGGDPNWGRITSAAGMCGVKFPADKLSLAINGVEIFRSGQPLAFDAAGLSQQITGNFETQIHVSVGDGSGRNRHWTSDLTVDYVNFNSLYTT